MNISKYVDKIDVFLKKADDDKKGKMSGTNWICIKKVT